MKKQIRVLVARSIEKFEGGCDDVRECDTMKEAREFARYALTESYQHSGEFSEPMNCTRIMRGDELVAEFWRKGWKPSPIVE